MNTDELESALFRAERRVLEIQTKLHRWARDEPHRRFEDLFNLVADPAFLLVAWDRVRGNKGARTAGVDGQSAYYVQAVRGVGDFLDGLRASLKDRSFCPLPVRERMIPQARRQATPVRDRDGCFILLLLQSRVGMRVGVWAVGSALGHQDGRGH